MVNLLPVQAPDWGGGGEAGPKPWWERVLNISVGLDFLRLCFKTDNAGLACRETACK